MRTDSLTPLSSSPTPRLVVIGASAGGLEAVRAVLARLPADFPAAVLVVVHSSPSGPSYLAEILGRASALTVQSAVDGAEMQPGHVYVSVPDCHLLVADHRLAVRRGPKENRFRPSVDALFRSAAYLHGPAVVGVVLSGMLDDGTSGLWTVKRLGGVSVVQTPSDALYNAMPQSALDNVEVDYVLPADSIGPLLSELVTWPLPGQPAQLDEVEQRRLEIEVQAAAQADVFDLGLMEVGELSPLTCPDCHGVLVQIREGSLVRFRCHTGHAYTARTLMDSLDDSVEKTLYQAVRSLEEAVLLFRQLERQQEQAGHPAQAWQLREKAQRTAEQARQIQALASVQPARLPAPRREESGAPTDD